MKRNTPDKNTIIQGAEEALMARKLSSFCKAPNEMVPSADETNTKEAVQLVDETVAERMAVLKEVGILDETESSYSGDLYLEKGKTIEALDANFTAPLTTDSKKQKDCLKVEGYLQDNCNDDNTVSSPRPTRSATGNRIISSIPGAHPSIPSWRQTSGTMDGESLPQTPLRNNNETSLVFGIGQEAEVDDGISDGGLVKAYPIRISTESAEPIDLEQQEERLQQKRQTSDRKVQTRLLMISFLLLVPVIGIGLAIALTAASGKPSRAEGTDLVRVTSTAAPTEQWTWQLPFRVPNTTTYTIQRDTQGQTPQFKAYLWMKDDPNLYNYTEKRLLQRYVLAVFYYATQGDQWDNQGGGITSFATDVTTTLALSTAGIPQREYRNGLQQPQPPKEDRNKSSLSGDVDCCVIGSHPSMGKHTKLVNITSKRWLSYRHSECEWFSTVSTIPKQVLSVCNSQQQVGVLALMRNHLMGSLPEELGLLTSLSVLVVGRNKMEGPIIPQIGNLQKMTGLHLLSNYFTGSVPSTIGKLSELKELSIPHNDLSGTLPPEVWNLPNMLELKIKDTGLSGSIPSNVGNLMPRLQLLMASRNSFSGTLPPSIGKFSHLVRLSANDNSISGTIPSEIGSLANITKLHLSNNRLSGVLPTQLGELSSLADLRLHDNPDITGPIPSELWNLSQLSVLQLDGTSVSGTIPEFFCQIQYLTFDCSSFLCGCGCPCQT